jgi:hypothetical protein
MKIYKVTIPERYKRVMLVEAQSESEALQYVNYKNSDFFLSNELESLETSDSDEWTIEKVGDIGD